MLEWDGHNLVLMLVLLCSGIKFQPITQPAKLRYPYLVVQTTPRQVKIAAHQLVAWLSQGPPPNKMVELYSEHWTPVEPSAEGSEETEAQQAAAILLQHLLSQQQDQPRVVVCHNDIPDPRPRNSKLEYTTEFEFNRAVVPHASICMSKKCVNPKCLYYDLQANNSRTGNNHRTLADKRSKRCTGTSCNPDTCPKCIRARARANK